MNTCPIPEIKNYLDPIFNDSLTKLMNFDISYLRKDYIPTKTTYDIFISNINSCIARCSKFNWGGDGEDNFSDKTNSNIEKFISLIGETIEKIPEIAATNDGQLSLEWIGKTYENILRINQFGIVFIKTVKNILSTNSENEVQMILSFDKNDEELKRTLYKIMKFINDEDTL